MLALCSANRIEKPFISRRSALSKQHLKSTAQHVIETIHIHLPENSTYKIQGKRCMNEIGFRKTTSKRSTMFESCSGLGYYI